MKTANTETGFGWIDREQAARIGQVRHFCGSYDARSFDYDTLVEHYMRGYVDPVLQYRGIEGLRSVADIGTGYGWLAIAFALRGIDVIAVDVNGPRVRAAQAIADIVGVGHRIEWRVEPLGALSLPDRSVEAAICIEVIEHTGTDREIVRDLARITRDLLMITTPNPLLPLVNHDTALPFAHWLPIGLRNHYAEICGRKHLQANNRFWTPMRLAAALPDFDRISRFLQYPGYGAYLAGQIEPQREIPRIKRMQRVVKTHYYRAAAMLERASWYVLPNLAATYRLKPGLLQSEPAAGYQKRQRATASSGHPIAVSAFISDSQASGERDRPLVGGPQPEGPLLLETEASAGSGGLRVTP